MTGLIESGAVKELPIWYAVYKRFSLPVETHRTYSQQLTNKNEANQNSEQQKRSKARAIIELMRWHKPIGTFLTLTPALWSVGLVTPSTQLFPDPYILAVFTAGAVAARGIGCTMNDILDRDYDRRVERTKDRPIACGDISTKEALVYLAIQSSLGLFILCLNNAMVIKLGLFSGFLIATYPLFKRFTYWPQVMLALTFNWGVLMGFAAVRNTIEFGDLSTLAPIYLGSIFWTLYYDTIYAHQDKSDDKFIGVKSAALKLGSHTKKFLTAMNIGMFSNLAFAGIMTEQLWPYYLSVIASNLFLSQQIRNVDLDNSDDCWKKFNCQKYVGLTILAGVLTSLALKSRRKSENIVSIDS